MTVPVIVPLASCAAVTEAAAASPQAAAPSAPATPADRATLTGVYELAPQRTFEVTLENGELYVTPRGGQKQQLVFRSGNTYTRDTDIITFIVENGVVTSHRFYFDQAEFFSQLRTPLSAVQDQANLPDSSGEL